MLNGWFLAWLTVRHVGSERNILVKCQLTLIVGFCILLRVYSLLLLLKPPCATNFFALTWRRGVMSRRTPLFELTLPLLSEAKKRSVCRRLLNRNISSRSISKRVSVYSTDSKQKSNAQTQFICHLRPFCCSSHIAWPEWLLTKEDEQSACVPPMGTRVRPTSASCIDKLHRNFSQCVSNKLR
jgi:hypothetical protein